MDTIRRSHKANSEKACSKDELSYIAQVATMKVLTVLSLLCCFATTISRANESNSIASTVASNEAIPAKVESNAAPTSVTIDGVTYEDVRWGRLTPATVTIYHSTGIATVPLASLPPDLQQKFGYDPQKAANWQAGVQKATAAKQAAEREAEKKANEQKAAELKAAAAAKAKAEKQKAASASTTNTAANATNAPPKKVATGSILRRVQQTYGH